MSSARTLLALLLVLAPALGTPPPGAAEAPRSWVVIAVVDSGINPYHDDFRAPHLRVHPSTYLGGFPADAVPLNLTLDAPSYADAKARDADVLAGVPDGVLHWIPGTKIVGAYRSGPVKSVNTVEDKTPILDDDGHGTKSASVAVGNLHGACPRCLLVVVEGFEGLAWAAAQPWIDLVSNSWGSALNAGVPMRGWGFENDATRPAAERGQTILFAAGNGAANSYDVPEQTWLSNANGPDWVMTVGSYVRTSNGERHVVLGTGHPVDVIGNGYNVPAADPFSKSGDDFHSGTSAATPLVAGAMGDVLLAVREAMRDPSVGQRSASGRAAAASGAPVPSSPPLADGLLTRQELWAAVFRTAQPTTSDALLLYPTSLPWTGTTADVALEGYGAVDAASAARAKRVLVDGDPFPERPAEDSFMAWDAYVRDSLWGAWDRDGDGRRDGPRLPHPPLP